MKAIILIILVVLLNSCEKKNRCCMDEPKYKVFKLRADYSNNVYIRLSSDKKKITGLPAPVDYGGSPDKKPFKMDTGYFLSIDGPCLDCVYLNITLDEYQTAFYSLSNDSMLKLILDPDPILEYYIDENRLLESKESFEEDTAMLNSWINKGELSKYLKRLK